jgi:Protein of unknown function DUF72
MGEMHHEWTAHQVRAWGRHGIHVGWSSGIPAGAECGKTALIDFDDLRRRHPSVMAGMREALPQDFRCVVAVESDVTTYRFSHRHYDRDKRGQRSLQFLEVEGFLQDTVPLLRGFLRPVDIVLFRFTPIYPTEQLSGFTFLSRLAGFCRALPREYRYAVELNTAHHLLPGYFDCLREQHVAHVLHDLGPGWSILEQVLLPGVFAADYALLRCGADPHALSGSLGLGLLEAVRRCVDAKIPLYAHIEASAGEEGRAEEFVSGFMEMMDPDLAKLSPLRRKAA